MKIAYWLSAGCLALAATVISPPEAKADEVTRVSCGSIKLVRVSSGLWQELDSDGRAVRNFFQTESQSNGQIILSDPPEKVKWYILLNQRSMVEYKTVNTPNPLLEGAVVPTLEKQGDLCSIQYVGNTEYAPMQELYIAPAPPSPAPAQTDAGNGLSVPARPRDDYNLAERGPFNIVNVNSDMCLRANGLVDRGADNRVTQFDCSTLNGSVNWSFAPQVDGSYRIRDNQHGECLTASYDERNGGDTYSAPCGEDRQDQTWTLEKQQNEQYIIRTFHKNEKCLDITSASKEALAVAQHWGCVNQNQQRFLLVEAPVLGDFAKSIQRTLKSRTPRVDYVDLPHTTLFATLVSGLAKDHVNGMAVMGSKYILNYPAVDSDFGNLLVYDGDDLKRHSLELDESGFPAGMQAAGNLVAVAMPTGSGNNKRLKIYEITGEEPELKSTTNVTPGTDGEFVGFAGLPNGQYYMVTPTNAYVAGRDLVFREYALRERVKTGEAGMALLHSDDGSELVLLALGTDITERKNDHYNYALYWLTKAKDGKFDATLLHEGKLKPPSNHTHDAASFRWAGTARIKDGNLEIFAAPKRIDAADWGSDLVKWTWPLSQ